MFQRLNIAILPTSSATPRKTINILPPDEFIKTSLFLIAESRDIGALFLQNSAFEVAIAFGSNKGKKCPAV
jgi:hypothetical protein